MSNLTAYLVSIVGGFLVTGPLVLLMRKTGGIESGKEDNFYGISTMYSWSLFWLGSTERGIATTLFIFAPTQLPVFIAGWSAAKIAAGWGRTKGVEYSAGHLSALVGTAWSFSIAVAAGYLASPASLTLLAK